jgi:hypothetical protein
MKIDVFLRRLGKDGWDGENTKIGRFPSQLPSQPAGGAPLRRTFGGFGTQTNRRQLTPNLQNKKKKYDFF